jgi:hypothetical protein
MAPLLLVVITSYAVKRLPDVYEALESLARHTYPTLEILFAGEGSREVSERVEVLGSEKGLANLRTLLL